MATSCRMTTQPVDSKGERKRLEKKIEKAFPSFRWNFDNAELNYFFGLQQYKITSVYKQLN